MLPREMLLLKSSLEQIPAIREALAQLEQPVPLVVLDDEQDSGAVASFTTFIEADDNTASRVVC